MTVAESQLAVVVLAAGSGTRMRSDLPKVLHPAAGRPMLEHVIRAAATLTPQRVVVVTGHGADRVEAAAAKHNVAFARQDRQLGTGHAFLQAAHALSGFDGDILVLYGDTPLLRAETLTAVVQQHRASGAGMTIITAELDDPTGYGRIIRAPGGEVLKIVEEKAASLAEKAVRETNSGVYVFSRRAISLAERIGNANPAGEYYLTDIVELYRAAGERVLAYPVRDADELMGVNDRVQLAFAEKVLRDRVRERLMREGVTLVDPASTFVDDTVTAERDAVIQPGCIIKGNTSIGRGAQVGPHSLLVDATLEDGAMVVGWTVIEGSTVRGGASVGPFARLRNGAVLESDAHVGNFVEIKNSRLASGAKAGHLAYIGDASVGEESNIGAGVITANYDGVKKNRTDIGAGAFIGSNSVLIAPVAVGEGAFVAAGSAISEDVPEGSMAVARGRQRLIEGWAERWWSRVLETTAPHVQPVIRRWLARREGQTVASEGDSAASNGGEQ